MEIRMTQGDVSGIVTKKCPFCFRNIQNSEAGFLIRSSGVHFQSPALNNLASERTDQEYVTFWSAMGVPEELIDARRIVVDNPMISELNRELSATHRELAVKHYDPESRGYSLQVDEGAVSLFSNTMVCPCCHNVLPQNFFRYDMLMVGMAGSVASGKTVYLSSLLMNGFEMLQRENLSVRSASGNPNDDYKLEMERNADRLLRRGICPESTSKSFKKPLFLEISYRLEDREITMLAAIYDVAGELIREATGSGSTGFVRHMDGYICLVDPAQMHLSHSVITNRIPDEGRILDQLRLMNLPEQIAVQKMSNENGKMVMDQMDYMADEGNGEGLISERKAGIIMEAIRTTLGDGKLREKYMALTIAKSDLLEELKEIRDFRGSELLFQREQVKYGFMDTDLHFLRQNVLSRIFDQKVYRLQKSLDAYKASSLFAVSALGCETTVKSEGGEKVVKAVSRINPIRIEEPLLWMIMRYMQERGWLS